MPARPPPDLAPIDRVLRALAAGPASAQELCQRLGLSQPTFSRAVRGDPRVLVVGRARTTRYAARRDLDGVSLPIPVYSVRPTGEPPRHVLDLHPVEPDGFYLEPVPPWTTDGGFVDDLPWFLANLRPAGFLGRFAPLAYPSLGAPGDILVWSADHVLRFATRYGWNLPGALIAGHEAFRAFVEHATDPLDRVEVDARAARYPELAAAGIAAGPAGSSAGGEQPKFLATVDAGGVLTPVLVKFSPPLVDDKAVRAADLLVAEHVAHRILDGAGHATARSALLRAGGRLFLEVERFDREGPDHRRGVVPLGAVDGEFVGSQLDRWSTTTARLVELGLLGEADHREVRWREVFGDLIANSDMHPNNLSLWLDDLAIAGVAPSYDLLPMRYAIRQNELAPVDFRPRVPHPADRDVARSAWEAALAFWQTTGGHDEVSGDFRRIAQENADRLLALAPALARLPS